MKRTSTTRKNPRTPQQVERDRAVRKKFQAERPSLESLAGDDEYTEPLSQGEYLSLMEYAAAVKAIRARLKLTLAEVSAASGIDKAALSRLESGQVDNPTYHTLQRVANALGMQLRLALEVDPSATAT